MKPNKKHDAGSHTVTLLLLLYDTTTVRATKRLLGLITVGRIVGLGLDNNSSTQHNTHTPTPQSGWETNPLHGSAMPSVVYYSC